MGFRQFPLPSTIRIIPRSGEVWKRRLESLGSGMGHRPKDEAPRPRRGRGASVESRNIGVRLQSGGFYLLTDFGPGFEGHGLGRMGLGGAGFLTGGFPTSLTLSLPERTDPS